MNFSEYTDGRIFSKGLPQGDTVIDLVDTDFSEEEFDGKRTTKVILSTGQVYFLPDSVMAKITAIGALGRKKARVTRNGFGMTDTKYTVVGLD